MYLWQEWDKYEQNMLFSNKTSYCLVKTWFSSELNDLFLPVWIPSDHRMWPIFKLTRSLLGGEGVNHDSRRTDRCNSGSGWDSAAAELSYYPLESAAEMQTGTLDMTVLWQILCSCRGYFRGVFDGFSGWSALRSPSLGHDHHRAFRRPASGLPAKSQHHVHHDGP